MLRGSRAVPVRREFNGYTFTGDLRPAPLSATRVVPPHIKRPDYADHMEGEYVNIYKYIYIIYIHIFFPLNVCLFSVNVKKKSVVRVIVWLRCSCSRAEAY